MKIEIIFTGDIKEDKKELNCLLKANDMATALFEIAYNLWRDCKEIPEFLEKIDKKLTSLNIDLDNLIE